MCDWVKSNGVHNLIFSEEEKLVFLLKVTKKCEELIEKQRSTKKSKTHLLL